MRTFDDLVPDAEALARAWMHAAQEGAAAETTRERRTTRRLARLVAIPLDEFGVAVDGEQELVEQVFAHAGAPFGYQVK